MTPAGVLDRVLPRWRATLASRYSPGDLDSFIERNRTVLENLASRAMTRRRPSTKVQTPHWFELYSPRGGVPRETLPGYRRARELAAAIFDRALSLLDEPAGEIDLDLGRRPARPRRPARRRRASSTSAGQPPAQTLSRLTRPQTILMPVAWRNPVLRSRAPSPSTRLRIHRRTSSRGRRRRRRRRDSRPRCR